MKYLSRRNFLKTTALASAGAVLANHPITTLASPKQSSEPTLKGKKVLFPAIMVILCLSIAVFVIYQNLYETSSLPYLKRIAFAVYQY